MRQIIRAEVLWAHVPDAGACSGAVDETPDSPPLAKKDFITDSDERADQGVLYYPSAGKRWRSGLGRTSSALLRVLAFSPELDGLVKLQILVDRKPKRSWTRRFNDGDG